MTLTISCIGYKTTTALFGTLNYIKNNLNNSNYTLNIFIDD